MLFLIHICALHWPWGTFYYDFSSVIIFVFVVVVDGGVVVVSGWCVLIGVAAAFDFYASILLHIVVCTDRQSIFYALPSLCTLLRQRQLLNNFCFMPQHINMHCVAIAPFVFFRFLPFSGFCRLRLSSCYAPFSR